jgi:hypothetical protein
MFIRNPQSLNDNVLRSNSLPDRPSRLPAVDFVAFRFDLPYSRRVGQRERWDNCESRHRSALHGPGQKGKEVSNVHNISLRTMDQDKKVRRCSFFSVNIS